MHFSQAVASIQSLVGVIRGVHIVYRDEHNFKRTEECSHADWVLSTIYILQSTHVTN